MVNNPHQCNANATQVQKSWKMHRKNGIHAASNLHIIEGEKPLASFD
jgi:uncharacterized protein (UPF0548 family)